MQCRTCALGGLCWTPSKWQQLPMYAPPTCTVSLPPTVALTAVLCCAVWLLQVPGQQVATHYDVPWFYGASRFTLPQWLLVVMDRSGLWADRVVPQMQGVAYLHKWPKERTNNGGNFFFYPAGPYDRVEV